jgi:hypothetical protein
MWITHRNTMGGSQVSELSIFQHFKMEIAWLLTQNLCGKTTLLYQLTRSSS